MNIGIKVAIILLFLFTSGAIFSEAQREKKKESNDSSTFYNENWDNVKTLEGEGKPRSALKILDLIYNKSKEENNTPMLAKAIIHQLKFVSQLDEEEFYTAFNKVRQEIKTASTPSKQIFHSMLGEMYWNYYQRNRIQFLGRTEIKKNRDTDVRKWDLSTIVKYSSSEYMKSLESPEELAEIPITSIEPILNFNKENDTERPTLYDFLIHRAIDFYSNSESTLTSPKDKFYVSKNTISLEDKKDYLLYHSDIDKFIGANISNIEESSFPYKGVLLLQRLLKFRLDIWKKSKSEKDFYALLSADIKRHTIIYSLSIEPNKRTHYLNALLKLKKKYESHPASSEISYLIAKEYALTASLYNPKFGNLHKDSAQKAVEVCQSVAFEYPDNFGGKNCNALLNSLQEKVIQIQVEKTSIPNKEFPLLLTHKNLDDITFSIFPVSSTETENLRKGYEDKKKRLGYYPFETEVINFYANKKPLKSFTVNLKNPKDYNTHSSEIIIPSFPVGEYILFASEDKKLNLEKNGISFETFRTSDIAYFNRFNNKNLEFYLTSRTTGEPLKNVSVRQFEQTYDNKNFKFNDVLLKTLKSDDRGYFSLPQMDKTYINYYLEVESNNEKYLIGNSSSPLGDNPKGLFYQGVFQENPQLEIPNIRTFFFTDRAIYRPGQKIYFKAIPISTLGSTNKILPSVDAVIQLLNVNRVMVSEIVLKTNEFGSISGTFTIPTSGITGNYTLQCTNFFGDYTVSVEDYKRPKFKVEIQKPKTELKLNENLSIKVLAKAYSGAPIDNAKVKYTVKRSALFPHPRYSYGFLPPISPEAMISVGETITNNKGEFEIPFESLPDETISPQNEPIFNFQVLADVTDVNGETVSNTLIIPIGYTSMRVELNIPEVILAEKFKEISVEAKNLSGNTINSSGTLELYRLQAPEYPLRTRIWNLPDHLLYSQEEWHNSLPLDPYGAEDNRENWQKEEKVYSTSFDTSNGNKIPIKVTEPLKSGVYIAMVSCSDSFKKEVKDYKIFSITNATDKKLPSPDNKYFHISKKKLEVGDSLELYISNAYKGKSLLEIEKNDTIISSEWLDPEKLDSEQIFIKIPITEKERGNFGLHYTFIANNRLYTKSETILVPYSNKELSISFQTFRNKLQPGEEEEWKLKIEGYNKDKVMAELLLTMYDASLDSFRVNNFYFDIYSLYYASKNWSSTNAFQISNGYSYSQNWNSPSNYISKSYRNLNWFGYTYTFVSPVYYKRMRVYSPAPQLEDRIKIAESAPSTSSSISKRVTKEKKEKSEVIPEINQNIRSDFRETAFFYPDLKTDENGNIILSFKLPDSLTTWKVLGFAHTKDLEFGFTNNELIAQKKLMVVPNAPRFFREGDTLEFSAKLKNLSKESLWGKTELELYDPRTMKNISSRFFPGDKKKQSEYETSFEIKEEGSTTVSWVLRIPQGISSVLYRVNASSGKYSDGEEMILPILSNRMLVTETLPLSIIGKKTETFSLTKLINSEKSETLKHHRLTLEYTSNPIWLALSSLPYLAEYPYECMEQTFSRYYANSLSLHITKENPEIEKVFSEWRKLPLKNQNSLTSNLEKNQELKSLILEETPWLTNSLDENENKRRIANLFDTSKTTEELGRALFKLKENQLSDGSWSWFKGMQGNRFITQYLLSGFGHLKKVGIYSKSPNTSVEKMVDSGVRYLDKTMREDYEYIKQLDKKKIIDMNENQLSPIVVHYLYTRSFFANNKISEINKEAFNYFISQAKKYKFSTSIYSRGMIALALNRFGDTKTANKILESLKENAIQSKEMGIYWKSNWSYNWHEMPVETQSLLIEAFYEIEGKSDYLNKMKVWLLKQKQTNQWSTTKSTSSAIYSLLLGDTGIQKAEIPEISLGETIINKDTPNLKIETGSGYFKTHFPGNEIVSDMGNIKIKSLSKGVSFGGVFWQYFQNLDKITKASTPLHIEKNLFLQTTNSKGVTLTPIKSESLKMGDLLKVRIEISVDRDMEFVHLKDMRASALEPLNVISSYKYRDGLGFYESTRDASTNFFFDRLPKGVYVFEYPLRVSQKGEFSNGITTIQCMYAPEFSSHSEGIRIKVE